MSLADRYPRLRHREQPSWLRGALDDDTDLVQAARRSFIEAVQEASPAASFPVHVDLRLSGPSTAGGRLPADALPIAERFQQEIRAAIPSVGAQLVDIDWVGVSEGSAVMHMAPRFPEAREGELDLAKVGEFESALAHVLHVHDLLEQQAEDAAFVGERPNFLQQLRLLTDDLASNNLDLEVAAAGSQGVRYHSTLSRAGRIRAAALFEKSELSEPQQVLAGVVVGVDLEAETIQLRIRPKKRIQIERVPREVLVEGSIRVGQPSSIEVQPRHRADRTGGQSADRYEWVGVAGRTLPFEGELP